MARHPRLFIPGASCHVVCRVARGEFVFDDDFEAQEFAQTLREVRDLDTWTIYARCLDDLEFRARLNFLDASISSRN